MSGLFKILFCSASLAALSLPAYADYTLTILHTNDTHSRIEEVNKYDATCSAKESAEQQCFGGMARLKAAIDTERAKANNVLVLDAGDQFQGSLFFTTYKGTDNAEFMNAIGYDAMALGNHEFDLGQEGLAPFLNDIRIPVLSANIESTATSPIHGKFAPYLIKTVGGEKIGIIGLTTPDTVAIARPGKDMRFLDAKETLQRTIPELKQQGITKIIALTHLGYDVDQQLAAELNDLDAIVGGHSHTLLGDNARASGPYPTLVKNPSGKMVPVVTAYAYTQYLGRLVLNFDDEGNLKTASGSPLRLDASIKPDEQLAQRIAEMAKPIEELKNRRVAETAKLIDGSAVSCRTQQCPMGDLVTNAMLDRVRDQGITAALINGGALRASIKAGEITMGDVLVVLPFQNTVATFQIKGSDLRAALENGVSQIEKGSGRYPQVSGIKFTTDIVKPAGQRIGTVEIQDADKNWQPLDDTKLYGIAATDYLRTGGDGYTMIAEKAEKAYDYGPALDQVVAEYLQEHSPYAGEVQQPAKRPESKVAATYVIQKGDSYWSIAQALYGNGMKWKQLFQQNRHYKPRHLPVGASLKTGAPASP
ncbi:MAG: 5'-nucleotidase C-terminal domain-containing protein [Brucellaceae bacterium]|jgi:5'-nucleotidase|nr:5'-nucleotidase C-terminal domain-containing protein [Brucellaceae bacterium]